MVTALTIRPDRHYRLLIDAAAFVIVAAGHEALKGKLIPSDHAPLVIDPDGPGRL